MSGTIVTKVSPEVARPREADFFQDTAAFKGSASDAQAPLPSSQTVEEAAATASATAATATAAEEEAVPADNDAEDAATAEVLPAAATPEETPLFDPTPVPDADPVASSEAAVPDASVTLPDALEAAAEDPAPQTQPDASEEAADVVLAPSTLQQIEQMQQGVVVHDAASLPLEASQDVGMSQDLLGPTVMGPPPTPPPRLSSADEAAPAAAAADDAAADAAAPLIFSFASSEEAVETVRATDVVVLPEWDQPPAKRVRRSTSAATTAAAEPSLKEVVDALQYCTKFGIPHLALMRLLTRNGTIAAGIIEEMKRDERLVQAYAAFLVLDQTDIEGEDGGLVPLPSWQAQLLASHPLLKQDYTALLELHPRCLRCRLQWCRQVATRGNPSSLDVPASSLFPAPACTRADYPRLRKTHVDGCVKARKPARSSSSPRGKNKRDPNAS